MNNHLKGFLLAVLVLIAAPVLAAPVNTGHVKVELVPAASAAAPGSTIYIALHQKIAPGWHTYWRNPGDAGEPPKLGWTLPAGWRAGDIVWPAPPRKLAVGPLMDYGYEDEVYLPVPISAPTSAKPGSRAPIKASISLLVCKEVCIPEDATLTLDLPIGTAGQSNAAVQGALNAVPKSGVLTATMQKRGARLMLAATGAPLKGAKASDAYFFPYDSTVIKHPAPQAIERGPEGLTLTLQPGYAFTKGDGPKVLSGVLAVDGRAYEIDARAGPLPAAARGLGAPPKLADASGARGGMGLWLAIGSAFLGGVILNLMPCVFPILSMKAVALARHADEASHPRLQGAAFLAGVLATFLGLAAVLILARSAGTAVGWGFQLQSPGVVAALTLVMLAIGLNLSGVYEIGTSLMAAGPSGPHTGALGSALTGALAVIVAAPCTAPFMAGAIAFALTQSEWAALLVFAGLGLGFAAPFTLLSFAPGLLRKLPRPGPWMDGLRKVLAFPMYGAAAWLAWVLTQQAGATALGAVLAAGVVLALGAWLWGVGQRQGRLALTHALAVICLLLAAGAAVAGLRVSTPPSGGTAAASGALPKEVFSPTRLAELQGAHKPVFVNFTAAWCITCQVNERAALSSRKVADAFARAGAVYMEADWTRRDAEIAEALAAHGRAGVPLYLVYAKAGGQPQVLPQILSEDAVIRAVETAAR